MSLSERRGSSDLFRTSIITALIFLAGCGSDSSSSGGIDTAAGTGQSLPVSTGKFTEIPTLVGADGQNGSAIRPLVLPQPNQFSVRASFTEKIFQISAIDSTAPRHSFAFPLFFGYLPPPQDLNTYTPPQPLYDFIAQGTASPNDFFLSMYTVVENLAFDPDNPSNINQNPIPIPAGSSNDGSTIQVTSNDTGETATFKAGAGPESLYQTVTVTNGNFTENITVSRALGSGPIGNNWTNGPGNFTQDYNGVSPLILRTFYYKPKPKTIKINNPTSTQTSTNTTLNFGITTVNTTLNQWSVDIKQNNAVIMSFAPTNDTRGPGIAQGDNPYNISLTWDGRDKNSQTVVGNYTWVMAANTTDFVAGNNNNDGVNSTVATLAAATNSGKISIENAAANPVGFDPAKGEKSTLGFDIVTHDISQPAINWQVSILSPNNTTLYTFPAGSSNDGSTSVHVSQLWSGQNAAGNVITGSFTWAIAANTTTQVAGQGGTGEVALPVYVAGVASPSPETLLKVESIGTSVQELGLDVPLAKQDQAFTLRNRPLLKKVFAYGQPGRPSGQNDTWKITATGIRFEDPDTHRVLPDLPSLTVRLRSSISHGNVTTQLNSIGPSSYSGNFVLSADLIKPDTNITFATVSALERSFDFLQLVHDSQATGVWPLPRVPLGDFVDSLLTSDASAAISQASASADNVRCGGFEVVTVGVERGDNANLVTPLSAVIKVRHPAKLLYISSHGGHDGQLNLSAQVRSSNRDLPREDLSPSVSFSDPNVLDTVIFDACEVLDLYDYNNVNLNKGDHRFASDPVEKRSSPGLLWHAATQPSSGGPHPTLLGFNTVAAAFPAPGLLGDFGAELTRLGSLSNVRALAWMSAHYQVGVGTIRKSDTQLPLGTNQEAALKAAAWDGQYYYYIPYLPLEDDINQPDPNTALGIYRVELGKVVPTKWSDFPPDVALPVPVPGIQYPKR